MGRGSKLIKFSESCNPPPPPPPPPPHHNKHYIYTVTVLLLVIIVSNLAWNLFFHQTECFVACIRAKRLYSVHVNCFFKEHDPLELKARSVTSVSQVWSVREAFVPINLSNCTPISGDATKFSWQCTKTRWWNWWCIIFLTYTLIVILVIICTLFLCIYIYGVGGWGGGAM